MSRIDLSGLFSRVGRAARHAAAWAGRPRGDRSAEEHPDGAGGGPRPARAAGAAEPHPSGRRRALLVGRDHEALELVRATLQMVDIDAATAPDAKTALALLCDGPTPCAVVCERLLPGISGLAFLARLCRDYGMADVPAIVLSDDEQPQFLPANVQAWLAKPLRPEQTCAVLLGLLASREVWLTRGGAQPSF